MTGTHGNHSHLKTGNTNVHQESTSDRATLTPEGTQTMGGDSSQEAEGASQSILDINTLVQECDKLINTTVEKEWSSMELADALKLLGITASEAVNYIK
ncbi:hypothetical protein H0H87_012576, partial [Tephrocybe sp. NHM501043]